MRGINELSIPSLVEFCEREGIAQLKFLDVIRDLDGAASDQRKRLALIGRTRVADLYTDMACIESYFDARSKRRSLVQQGELGHPLKSYILDSGLQVLIKDHRAGAWYSSICKTCTHYPCHDALMAVRVTADMRLQHCLLGDHASVTLAAADVGDFARLSQAVRSVIEIYETAEFVSVTRHVSSAIGPHTTLSVQKEASNGEVLYAIQRR